MNNRHVRKGYGILPTGMRRCWFWLVVGICLSGCSALSPAASMRVDVEVYKGPLAKLPEAQLGELEGIVADAETSLGNYQKGIAYFIIDRLHSGEKTVEPVAGNLAATKDFCSDLTRERWPTWWHIFKREDRLVMVYACDLFDNAEKLKVSLQELNTAEPVGNIAVNTQIQDSKPSSNCTRTPPSESSPVELSTKECTNAVTAETAQQKIVLKEVIKVAAQLKARAAAVGASFIPLVSGRNDLRTFQALLAGTASEYGNLIGSRAAVLMLQLDGKSREELPLSAYLMDSGSTEAMNIYDWYNAKSLGILEEWDWFIPGNSIDMTTRVRAYEKLFADIYWSKVNTVYASGVGDVNMALIRDEVGNWNLKNFSSNPSALLSAYQGMTLTGIKTATRIIDGAKDPGALKSALQITQQLITVPRPTAEASLQKQVDKLHALTDKALHDLEQEYADKADCKENDNSCLNESIQRAGKILEYHGQLLNVLQDFSSSSETHPDAATELKKTSGT